MFGNFLGNDEYTRLVQFSVREKTKSIWEAVILNIDLFVNQLYDSTVYPGIINPNESGTNFEYKLWKTYYLRWPNMKDIHLEDNKIIDFTLGLYYNTSGGDNIEGLRRDDVVEKKSLRKTLKFRKSQNGLEKPLSGRTPSSGGRTKGKLRRTLTLFKKYVGGHKSSEENDDGSNEEMGDRQESNINIDEIQIPGEVMEIKVEDNLQIEEKKQEEPDEEGDNGINGNGSHSHQQEEENSL